MRRILLLLAALVLAACATVPRSIELSQAQLEAALARKLPLNTRYLELLDVSLTSPRLTLLPESNRLRIDLAAAASDRITRRPLHGAVGFSFGLRYEPADASIRLAEVAVERFELQGLPAVLQGPQVMRLGAQVGERLLDGTVLHQFTPEQLARAQGMVPGEIRVTSDGVRVTLVAPVR